MDNDTRNEFLKMPFGELLILAKGSDGEPCGCDYRNDCDCSDGLELCPSGVEVSPSLAKAFLLEMHSHIEEVICK